MTEPHRVDFTPATDPLLRDARLDHAVVLPVLGILIRFESNSRFVIAVVDRAFGRWRIVADAAAETRDPLRVRIIVTDGVEQDPIIVRHWAPDAKRIIAHTAASVGVSDPDRREAVICASRDLVATEVQFRGAMLDAMTLALLAQFDRHPVHAAALAHSGRAVLLAGESGVGKSTLAHLANDAGFDVMSEDTTWIQLDPALRVWGWPGYARLLASSAGDKTLTQLGADRRSCFVADDVSVCILRRGETASLDKASPEVIREALDATVAPGFDRFPQRHRAVVAALARNGGWQLTLSVNPADAVPLLDRLLKST